MALSNKAKRPTEKAIETAILTYLNYLPGCYAWKNNSTGVYDVRRGTFRSNKNKFVINGVADILGIYNGRLLAIEVKRHGGKPTSEQLKFINKILMLGGIAGIAMSVDDAREIIKSDGGLSENKIKGLSE